MQINNYRNFPLSLKNFDDQGIISGYASVFSVQDKQNDCICYGAFKESIQNHYNNNQIKLLWQHQQDKPIGIFNLIAEDKYGLYIEAKLLLKIQKAREAYDLLKSGAINGLSIGYTPVEYEFDKSSKTRILTKINLWEISLVTFPANIHAGITNLKNYEINCDNSIYSELNRLSTLAKESVKILNTIVSLCELEYTLLFANLTKSRFCLSFLST
ncbi:phage prohead protease, HK97 family [Rickettsiales bacterium Ac37b]|nr:phage prohead protease, HK97 family [Rickettsiales bacterium Ac37b]